MKKPKVPRKLKKEFCWYRPVIERNGKYSEEHFIVRKSEFLALLNSRGGSDEADNLLRPSYERKRFEGRL